ncbi:hypothetical protein ACLB2K_048119 [Fragaria x ananassa]
MAEEISSKVSEAHPMNSGDGPNSYAKNSLTSVFIFLSHPLLRRKPQKHVFSEPSLLGRGETTSHRSRSLKLRGDDLTRSSPKKDYGRSAPPLVTTNIWPCTSHNKPHKGKKTNIPSNVNLKNRNLPLTAWRISERIERKVADVAKELVNKAILEKLDRDIKLLSNTFNIADLGCSVGPNTFYSVQNILEALQSKYQIQGENSQIPEFQIFFNDHAQNDFNMLFKSLPQNRQYFVAGVPGSFHGWLFPNASIHVVHCSYAIQWLSRVREPVVDSSSSAWNKGRIHYSNSTDEVIRAHETQYTEDMECFLHSRAQEIMYGGLMILMIPGRPDGSPHSQANTNLQILGLCLMDMARNRTLDWKLPRFRLPDSGNQFSVVEIWPVSVTGISSPDFLRSSLIAGFLPPNNQLLTFREEGGDREAGRRAEGREEGGRQGGGREAGRRAEGREAGRREEGGGGDGRGREEGGDRPAGRGRGRREETGREEGGGKKFRK